MTRIGACSVGRGRALAFPSLHGGRAALVVALAAAMTSVVVAGAGCAFFSGRLPCANDGDCLAGDGCGSDGLCAPSRGSGEGEGGAAGEGEGEGVGGERVRHVDTVLDSIVSVGVSLDDAFTLHVVPIGGHLCGADDCTPAGCAVSWSSDAQMLVSNVAPEQGVSGIGGVSTAVVVVVETSAAYAGGATATIPSDTGTYSFPLADAGHHFTEVTFHDGGGARNCAPDVVGGPEARCTAAFGKDCP